VGARVTWSSRAQKEVAEIRNYIERDSKANAVQVVTQLVSAANRLRRYPSSGRMIPEWNDPVHREVIVGSYRLMYDYSPEQVVVFSVKHVRRRVPKHFRKEWLE
jgi:toxin ParE1/3/4